MHGSPKQKTAKNVNLAQTSDLKTTNERDVLGHLQTSVA